MSDLPPPDDKPKWAPPTRAQLTGGLAAQWKGRRWWPPSTAAIIIGVIAILVVAAAVGSSINDDDENRKLPPSEAFCKDLRSGLTIVNLWPRDEDPETYAGKAYGRMAISCPEQLERHRAYFENWGINIDA